MVSELYRTFANFAADALGDTVSVYPATETGILSLPACVINFSFEPQGGVPKLNATRKVDVTFSLIVASDDESVSPTAREVFEAAVDDIVLAISRKSPDEYISGDDALNISFYKPAFFLDNVGAVEATTFGNAPALKIDISASCVVQA